MYTFKLYIRFDRMNVEQCKIESLLYFSYNSKDNW